jgi:hypothetical protein
VDIGNRHFWRLGRVTGLERLIMNIPAFPRPFSGTKQFAQEGMTLRDYFAAKAMHAIISDPDTQMSYEEIAIRAFEYAEAMLEVKNK